MLAVAVRVGVLHGGKGEAPVGLMGVAGKPGAAAWVTG